MKVTTHALVLACATFGSAQLTSKAWSDAYVKATAAVAKMSLGEKVGILTGRGQLVANTTGATSSAPSIGFPGLTLQDGPIGTRAVSNNSAFPAGITIAATWNRDLMRQRGAAIAAEFYGKGIHVHLGPMTNMMRAPAAGRNWEGFGGDPYLSGEATYEHIMGVQSQGVQATVKHLLLNEQEHQRMSSTSNADDRTLHEIYLHPFIRAVQAEVAAMMCSYNQLNGTYACENDKLLNGIVKGELGFRGYIMSDWFATHSTSNSANFGLDMDQPGGLLSPFFGLALQAANALGSVPTSRIDDMATRVLAAYYKLKQDTNYPALNLNAPVQADHATLIRQIAAAGTTLLKNKNKSLPIQKPASIAIIGSDAGANPDGVNSCTDRNCNKGVLSMGWGSGSAGLPYLVTPLDAITAKASTTGTNVTSSLSDTDLTAAKKAATGASYALVFISADSGEASSTVEGNAGDRNDLKAWHSGDALVNAVASVNNNTIVVVHSVGPIVVEPWIDNVNVTGLVFAHLPGQEAGNSLVDILWGSVNPSGRLPFTIAKSIDDYAAKVDYTVISLSPITINYDEALNIDYRHFDSAGIAPRFEFGFGLSYTTFGYSALSVSGSIGQYTPPTGNGSSVDASLHATAYTITATITNSGSVAGTEIPQLYLTFPASAGEPPYVLRGFEAVQLSAGQSKTVSFPLSRYALSTWSTINQRWEVASGTFGVAVGASSRDRRLSGSFTV